MFFSNFQLHVSESSVGMRMEWTRLQLRVRRSSEWFMLRLRHP